MTKWFLEITICFAFAGSFVSAQGEEADPVLRAKAQRALNNDQDLPPIPRGLTEPPPLPPPELHAHDIRKQRGSASVSARKKTTPAKKTSAPQIAAKKAPANTLAKKTSAPTAKTQSKAVPTKTTKSPSAPTASTAKARGKTTPAKTTAKPSNTSAPKTQVKSSIPAKVTAKPSSPSTGLKKAKA